MRQSHPPKVVVIRLRKRVSNMATWEITAPDGTAYEVEGDNEEGAMAALQKRIEQDVHEEYSNMPWYNKAATATGDISRIIGNLVTGGYRDKLAPYIHGGTPESQAYETEKARIRAGGAGNAAEMLPLLMLPELKAASTLGNVAIGAGEGGAFGGLRAGAHGEDVPEGILTGAATGGAVAGGAQMLRAVPRLLKKAGVGVAKQAGKLNITHALGPGGAGMLLDAIPGSPISSATAMAGSAAIPVVGAIGRALSSPAIRESVRKATQRAAKQAKDHKFFDPETRRLLMEGGYLGAKDKGED